MAGDPWTGPVGPCLYCSCGPRIGPREPTPDLEQIKRDADEHFRKWFSARSPREQHEFHEAMRELQLTALTRESPEAALADALFGWLG